jgi:hypothetical protein
VSGAGERWNREYRRGVQFAEQLGMGSCGVRVHQLTTDVQLLRLEEALGALRSCGWPAPEDPKGRDDEELAGRALVEDLFRLPGGEAG